MTHLIISSPQYDPGSESLLITDDNFQIDRRAKKFHTSMGDISAGNLIAFCQTVESVEFVDYGFKDIPKTRDVTIMVLNVLSHKLNIKNYKPGPVVELDFTMTRPTSDSVLWVFGCSYSHGVGVNPKQKYSSLVQQKLDLPLVDITKPGTSTRWGLQHLIHADIKSTDTVIWQITPYDRFTKKTSFTDPSTEVLLKNQSKDVLAFVNHPQLVFDHISLIDYGVQILRSIGCKFCMISIENKSSYSVQCLKEYTKFPEYCYIPNFTIDVGSDNEHPGPNSHLLVAQSILNKLQND